MVKLGVFKKIAALTATVAMVSAFAVSANAALVSTTTAYVANSNNTKISVTANVSGAGSEVAVTYYATNGDAVVYADQKMSNSNGEVSFPYVTDVADLKSAVKVGYKGADGAATGDVTGYTISGEGIEDVIVPTASINGTHTFAYAVTEGFEVIGVTSNVGTAAFEGYENGILIVSLSGVESDVELTVQEQEIYVAPDPEAAHIQSAGIVSDGFEDAVEGEGDVQAEAGDRKVSVIGKLLNVGENYGVIISKNAIEAADNLDAAPTVDAYAALGKNDDGLFAVQLIDTGDDVDGALLKSGGTIHTGLYYFNPKTEKYVVVAGATLVVGE